MEPKCIDREIYVNGPKMAKLLLLGRMDDMVKLNGYRIELDEVSGAISQDPQVVNCAVIVKDKRLVAYVSPKSVDIDRIRDTIMTRLPSYMIPSTFIAIEQFPLNSNGKVLKI